MMPYDLPYKLAEKPYKIRKAIRFAIRAGKISILLQKEGEDERMDKLKRTYRLSEEAIKLVENRDRKKYPTASDFIEAKIIASTEDEQELLYKVFTQLDELKSLLSLELQKKDAESPAFY